MSEATEIAAGHNPGRLTNAQVGAPEWRLLDEDEIRDGGDARKTVAESWEGSQWDGDYFGADIHQTYRTRLSRAELRAARGLPPEPENEVKPCQQPTPQTPLVSDAGATSDPLPPAERDSSIATQLRRLDSALERLAAVRVYMTRFKSDEIIAFCDCGTKTPELKFHEPGCRFRLISELDEARQRITEYEKLCDTLRGTVGKQADETVRVGGLLDALDASEKELQEARELEAERDKLAEDRSKLSDALVRSGEQVRRLEQTLDTLTKHHRSTVDSRNAHAVNFRKADVARIQAEKERDEARQRIGKLETAWNKSLENNCARVTERDALKAELAANESLRKGLSAEVAARRTEVKSLGDAVVRLRELNRAGKIECPNCYGGHFKPCQVCGDSGIVSATQEELSSLLPIGFYPDESLPARIKIMRKHWEKAPEIMAQLTCEKHKGAEFLKALSDYEDQVLRLESELASFRTGSAQLAADLGACKKDLDIARNNCALLRGQLAHYITSTDSYDVPGSEWGVCDLCGAEDQPGVFSKGIPHEPTCIMHGDCNVGVAIAEFFTKFDRIEAELEDAREQLCAAKKDCDAWDANYRELQIKLSSANENSSGRGLALLERDAVKAELDACKRERDSALKNCSALRGQLAHYVISTDSYGVPGSSFGVCDLCGAADGAGVFSKGVPHEHTCIMHGDCDVSLSVRDCLAKLDQVEAERDRWHEDSIRQMQTISRMDSACEDRNKVDAKREELHAEDVAKIQQQLTEKSALCERLERESRNALEVVQYVADALAVSLDRLGVCGEGDHKDRKADEDSWGGTGALRAARELLQRAEGKV